MTKPTILCVDDEQNVLLTLRTQLLQHFPNYSIEIAESGYEALMLIEELMADQVDIPLVIADQIMPEIKGDEFLIELHARHPQILSIMLTGQAKAEDVGHAVNLANLYRFIAKPWNETDLVLTVTEALRRWQHERQLAQQQRILAQANETLTALNADLEQRVQDRTKALEQEIRDRQNAELALQQLNEELEDRIQQRTQELQQQTVLLQSILLERQQAEAQLRETNAQLIVATRLKDEFLATMSHELRTPLNAILGTSECLLEELFGSLSAAQMKAIKTIDSSGHHLLDLITDILDLSHFQSGRIKLKISPALIPDICEASLIFVQQIAQKKKIHLSAQIADNIVREAVDELRIRQVLINLLSNAVKFTPEGGSVSLTVHRRVLAQTDPLDLAEPSQTWLFFAVADTGIGIASENLPKLFQPFVQVDSCLNRQYEGTGLGLALVHQIVELHGGKIDVQSEIGRGSCFTVQIPVCSSPLEDPAQPSVPLISIVKYPSTPPPPTTHFPLILLVEDNPANVASTLNFLTYSGYRVIVASNGEEAIELTQCHSPDLILMDIQLPKLDGLEAIRCIREELRLIKTPIIALTASAMDGDRDRCLQAGANDYITKPFSLRYLVTQMQTLLKTSASIVQS